MRCEFREGDWVSHRSFPEPLRVIGLGATIAVRFPNGDMQAFEPLELETASIGMIPQSKARVRKGGQDGRLGPARQLVSATSVCLICLIVLVLAMIAGTRP